MYEVSLVFVDNNTDTMLCESKPSINVVGGFVLLDCGKGQKLALSIDTLIYAKIKYPLPENVPDFKYSVDIHYHTDKENVELLFSPSSIGLDVVGEDEGYTPVLVVKENDNPIRIINSEFLRSVKVNTYSEQSK